MQRFLELFLRPEACLLAGSSNNNIQLCCLRVVGKLVLVFQEPIFYSVIGLKITESNICVVSELDYCDRPSVHFILTHNSPFRTHSLEFSYCFPSWVCSYEVLVPCFSVRAKLNNQFKLGEIEVLKGNQITREKTKSR